MDFQQDLRDEVMKWLPYDDADGSLVAELNSMPTTELLGRFFDWLNRLIHPRARRVSKSLQYAARRLPSLEGSYLERIIKMMENGEDFNPHLTRGVVHGFAKGRAITAKKKARSRSPFE